DWSSDVCSSDLIFRHSVVLLHAVLGHRILLHGILGHRVLFHAVVLAHFVLGEGGRRECQPKRKDGGGHAERDTGADGHWSVFPLKAVLKATDAASIQDGAAGSFVTREVRKIVREAHQR